MPGIGNQHLSHFTTIFVAQMIDGVFCLFASNMLFVFNCGLSIGAKARPPENFKKTLKEDIFVLFLQIPHNAFSFPPLWFSLQTNTVVQDATGISWDTRVRRPLFVYLYKWTHPKDMGLAGDHMSNGVQQSSMRGTTMIIILVMDEASVP